jgi:uncharacterized membrane protein
VFWLTAILQWVHIAFAMAWFGGSLAVNFLVVPAAARLASDDQASWWTAFSQESTRFFATVAGVTILFGIGRGIAGGVLSSLATPYGLTWIAALILSIGVAVWGARLTNPATRRIGEVAAIERSAAAAAASRLGRIELGGFVLVFTTMIAMRFGY